MNFEEYYQYIKEKHADIIVPYENFLEAISELTGWSKDELKEKDLGDIERKLNITAKEFESVLGLYKFIDDDTKKYIRKYITSLLNG